MWKLRTHIFEPGYYLYTGSALNELVSRISRHIRLDKPCHWHIDYITQAGRVTGIFWDVGREKMNACGPAKYQPVDPRHPPDKVLVRQIANAGRISRLSNVYRMINEINLKYSVKYE